MLDDDIYDYDGAYVRYVLTVLYRSAMAHMGHFLWTYPLGIPAKFLSVISCRTGIEISSCTEVASSS